MSSGSGEREDRDPILGPSPGRVLNDHVSPWFMGRPRARLGDREIAGADGARAPPTCCWVSGSANHDHR